MREGFTVYLVDDDAPIRDSLGLVLGMRGYRTAMFASAEAFLDALRPEWRGCLITDLRLPGLGGLDLQRILRERGVGLPVIVITGHGDVPAARAAFRSDAVDFLEKPFDDEVAIQAIEVAFDRELARLERREIGRGRERFWVTLTDRERQVAECILRGVHNKEIAASLSISPRTVEVHKARIMEKAGARSLADLIRIAGADPP